MAVAMGLGAAIGFERELARKPAGMRTHMLVSGAAALFIALAESLVAAFSERFNGTLLRADPVGVIQAVVTGVSFLGAGTIIRHGSENVVEGLTTAASLLFTAGIGLSAGLREFYLSTGATVLALITLRLIRILENRTPKN